MEGGVFTTTHTRVGDHSSFRQGHDFHLNIHLQGMLIELSQLTYRVLSPAGSVATLRPWEVAHESADPVSTDNNSEAEAAQIEASLLRSLRLCDYEAFRRRVPRRSNGTCEWILRNEQYKDWLHSDDSSILWVSGHPGCGKSVLASFLFEALRSPESQATLAGTVCHFFFKDDNIDQQKAIYAVSALVHQYLTGTSAKKTLQKIVDKIQQNATSVAEELESLDSMWSLLKEVSADPSGPNLICVVDAIDECEDYRDLMNLFKELYLKEAKVNGKVKASTALKIIVTGRPYTILERGFDKTRAIKINLEDVAIALEHDIRLVIDSEVGKFGTTLRLSSKMRNELAARLSSSADRTFLWIKLVLDELYALEEDDDYHGSESEIYEILNTVNLNEIYDKILTRASQRYPELARDVLSFVLVAVRPLSVTEMNIAIAIKRGDSTQDCESGAFPHPELALQNICGLLIRVIDANVSLIHSTAKEFLLTSFAASAHGSWKHSFLASTCDHRLGERCMIYLSHQKLEKDLIGSYSGDSKKDTIETVLPLTSRYGFLDYAAKNWAHHYHSGLTDANDRDKLFKLALDLCDSTTHGIPLWFQTFWTQDMCLGRCPHDATPLMIASLLNLEEHVEFLLEKGADVNEQTDGGVTALDMLALCNQSLNPSTIDQFPTAYRLHSCGARFAAVIKRGTIKWINQTKGFGWISPIAGGRDLFVNIGLVNHKVFSTLQTEDTVSYREKWLLKGHVVSYIRKEDF